MTKPNRQHSGDQYACRCGQAGSSRARRSSSSSTGSWWSGRSCRRPRRPRPRRQGPACCRDGATWCQACRCPPLSRSPSQVRLPAPPLTLPSVLLLPPVVPLVSRPHLHHGAAARKPRLRRPSSEDVTDLLSTARGMDTMTLQGLSDDMPSLAEQVSGLLNSDLAANAGA